MGLYTKFGSDCIDDQGAFVASRSFGILRSASPTGPYGQNFTPGRRIRGHIALYFGVSHIDAGRPGGR